jgi:hypothetical protein
MLFAPGELGVVQIPVGKLIIEGDEDSLLRNHQAGHHQGVHDAAFLEGNPGQRVSSRGREHQDQKGDSPCHNEAVPEPAQCETTVPDLCAHQKIWKSEII